jgi:hypothetical protein
MYIDEDLRMLPSATVGKRFAAFILDRFLLLVIPALFGLILLPVYLGLQLMFSPKIGFIFLSSGMVIAFLFTLIWGNWLRVGENAQTLGMSIMNIAIASDHAEFKSNLMNRWFFWVNIANKDMKTSWAGDEIEERTDAQLWRGLLPVFMFPAIAGLAIVLLGLIARLPFVIWSLITGNFSLSASNNIVSIVFVVPIAILFLIAQFGFLFAFGKEQRTLTDHFLGIKIVDVQGTRFSFQPKRLGSLLNWFMGNKPELISHI